MRSLPISDLEAIDGLIAEAIGPTIGLSTNLLPNLLSQLSLVDRSTRSCIFSVSMSRVAAGPVSFNGLDTVGRGLPIPNLVSFPAAFTPFTGSPSGTKVRGSKAIRIPV